ncbi:class I SAM-dependent RNA methyltransferase [Poseidonocella sedimentorum]|uniref:23S rRNA m(5)U-1939 methyltransferase n=1 Tax=Poseidonocella sedimentorum TaxID=871652 RepID=A0A1I6D4F1_9RHOB|nr:class I SAM-dependent RNA methyltransferase [Poseidonocella sedimentorum]SFR00359.1 23S rRNA m(5)U-1939 methyltransferase [Poseidonocella sedimentorum]
MDTYLIDRLGLQGDGIAAGPVFAPRTLPGERVRGRLDGDRLTDIAIEEPVAARVSPPCPQYRACGGCQLQHASDDFVAGWKQDIVRAALEAQGLAAPIRQIHSSPPASRRRAVFSARRTKKGVLAGFHGRASDVIVDVPDCRVIAPELHQGRALAAALASVGTSRKGELKVLVTRALQGLDVAVEGGKPLDVALRMALAELAQSHGVARLTWAGETVAMEAPPEQRFGAAVVSPPPGAFLQATGEGEAALVAAVREAVADAAHLVDLFAGCGTFALPLAARASVHAVEGSGPMLAALDRGWRQASGLRNVTTETRDLFRDPLLGPELRAFDAAVIDPPRAGAVAQTAALAEDGPPRIAFVSCNPVTFARDARVLTQAGYRMAWLDVVDQFRWSPHVELVASFLRDGAD